MPTPHRTFAVEAAAALALACAADPAPDPVAAPEPAPAPAPAYFAASFNRPLGALASDAVTLIYDDGTGPHTIAGAAFRTDLATPSTDSVAVPGAGRLRLRVVITQGDTLGVGDVSVETVPGVRHSAIVSVVPATFARLLRCIGCTEPRAFPLRRRVAFPTSAEPIDSFYVMWHERPINFTGGVE